MTYEYQILYPLDPLSLGEQLEFHCSHGWRLAVLIDRPAVCYAVLERPIAQPDPPRTVVPAVGRKKAIAK